MISRREVVTAGVLGTFATGGAASPAEAVQDGPTIRAGLTEIKQELATLNGNIQRGHGSSLDMGRVGQVKGRIETYLKASGKFPEFCDIGTSVFYDVYEWHVKHQQQINVTRMADQRLMIQFMFTQLVLRWENESNYIGMPFDR
jgi:hypothetical protein